MICKNCIGGEMYKYGKTKDGRQVFKCRNCKTKRVEFKIKRYYVRRSKETCEKIRKAKLEYWANLKDKKIGRYKISVWGKIK